MPNSDGLYSKDEVNAIVKMANTDALLGTLKSDYGEIIKRLDASNHLKELMATKGDLQTVRKEIQVQFADLKAQVLTIDQFSLVQVKALQLLANRQLDHDLHRTESDHWWERIGVKVAVTGGILGAILLALNTLVAVLAIKGH